MPPQHIWSWASWQYLAHMRLPLKYIYIYMTSKYEGYIWGHRNEYIQGKHNIMKLKRTRPVFVPSEPVKQCVDSVRARVMTCQYYSHHEPTEHIRKNSLKVFIYGNVLYAKQEHISEEKGEYAYTRTSFSRSVAHLPKLSSCHMWRTPFCFLCCSTRASVHRWNNPLEDLHGSFEVWNLCGSWVRRFAVFYSSYDSYYKYVVFFLMIVDYTGRYIFCALEFSLHRTATSIEPKSSTICRIQGQKQSKKGPWFYVQRNMTSSHN